MDTSGAILDPVIGALDAQSLVIMTAVIEAGKDHLIETATEEAAVQYLNVLEAPSLAVNRGLVGPVTAAEIRSRVRSDVAFVKRNFPGIIEKATLKSTDLCEIKPCSVASRPRRWRDGKRP